MPTAGTEAIQFKSVGLDNKTVLGCDLFLQPLDLAILKFHNGSTAGTDEVVVMPLVGDIIVLRLGAEMPGLGNPGLTKQVQGAVDGGQSQVRVFFGELVIHRFCCDVFLPKEGRQDQFSLAR